MEGNEKEKPPDEGGGSCNAVNIENNSRKRNIETLQLSPSTITSEPFPKKITTGEHMDKTDVQTIVIEPNLPSVNVPNPPSVDDPNKQREPSQTLPGEANPHLYTHPDLDNECRGYSSDDPGPFVVHISRKNSSETNTPLKAIHIGKILTQANIKNIRKDGGVKSVGRNRVAVTFINANDANLLLKSPILTLNKLSANIPSYHISRMGLVRGVPIDWSMHEFVEGTELKEGKGKILKARRLQRKVSRDDGSPAWVPTQSVVVTLEGQSLPPRIYAYYTSLVVEIYLLPTIQCRKCLRFGHIQTQCRSDARCFKCSEKHPGSECNVAPEHVRCIYCAGSHHATDPRCPEHTRQKSIKLVMSENNISYAEAAAQFKPVKRPYSDMAQVMFSPAQDSSRSSQSPLHPAVIHFESPTSTSYRKTIYRAPRARTPLSPGYDRLAHEEITRTPTSQLPNGQAFAGPSRNAGAETPNEDLFELLFKLLTNIIAKWSDFLPNNVAPLMINLAKALSFCDGPPGHLSTMEF
jgi:hypothetical protein